MNYCLCLLAKINVRSFNLWFGFGKAFLFLSLLQQALLSVSFVLPKPCLSKAPSAERASLPCACVCRGPERRERERKREGETDTSISIAWKAPPHLPTWWAGSSILREAWWHAVKLGYCVLFSFSSPWQLGIIIHLSGMFWFFVYQDCRVSSGL